MRVAFAGSPSAALAPLHALAASRHEVALVVTQPPRRRGRSGRPQPTVVAEAADALGLPLIAPTTINGPDALARLRDADVGALCVVAFGQLLRDAVLSGWPCLNVHFSLLPAYRGAAPVERALMDGAAETGVSVMRMNAGLDTGPVISEARVAVGVEEDAGALTARLSQRGGPLLVAALDALAAGGLRAQAQPEEGVSLAPRIGPADRPLDPTRPARALADQVRALSPHIGATLGLDGAIFKIWVARSHPEPSPPGARADGGRLLLGTGDGTLELLVLQPPGRGRMEAAAFLRGWRGPLTLDPPSG